MNSDNKRGFDALLAKMKREWPEILRFYSNAGRRDREAWVVVAFLKSMGVSFTPDELTFPPQDDPVDVSFRSAKFQVKEILDPNSTRTRDIRNTARKVAQAQKLDDTLAPLGPSDVPPPIAGNELVLAEATSLSRDTRYLATKGAIDLLIYVTRTRTSPVVFRRNDVPIFEAIGWRSVSVLMGVDHAIVLFARSDAPDFLQNNAKPGS